jgi:hypothetical protein
MKPRTKTPENGSPPVRAVREERVLGMHGTTAAALHGIDVVPSICDILQAFVNK